MEWEWDGKARKWETEHNGMEKGQKWKEWNTLTGQAPSPEPLKEPTGVITEMCSKNIKIVDFLFSLWFFLESCCSSPIVITFLLSEG